MGILDSLAQILPYAIPAAAGAALGGPGLGMVGAGAAAQAENNALAQQMKIASMLNEAQYRNADLGLRKQEIQSNEQLRKDALNQQAYEAQQNRQVKTDEGQANRDARQQMANDANAIRQQVADQGAQFKAFQEQEAAARDADTKQKIADAKNQHILNSVQYAKDKAQQAAEAAWKDKSYFQTNPFWGVDHDKFVADFKKKHTLDFLSIQDPKALEDAEADPDVVAMAKDKQAANARAAKLSAPGIKPVSAHTSSATPATLKTSMPDTPPGQAYHINGKKYQVKGGVATEVPNG